jgi:hypothetical protein
MGFYSPPPPSSLSLVVAVMARGLGIKVRIGLFFKVRVPFLAAALTTAKACCLGVVATGIVMGSVLVGVLVSSLSVGSSTGLLVNHGILVAFLDDEGKVRSTPWQTVQGLVVRWHVACLRDFVDIRRHLLVLVVALLTLAVLTRFLTYDLLAPVLFCWRVVLISAYETCAARSYFGYAVSPPGLTRPASRPTLASTWTMKTCPSSSWTRHGA